MLVAIDVDEESDTFCQILSKCVLPYVGDEVHHTGWNACSSCHDKPSAKRTHIILPCLNSSRIYFVNVEDERNIRLDKIISPEELQNYNASFPHTCHCLADGNIMINTCGDGNNNNKGNFLLIDGKTFEPKDCYLEDSKSVPFSYDYWYQPRRDVMISSEWGSPKRIKEGFDPTDLAKGNYGHSVHVYKWSTHEKLKTIELPICDGALPFEVRYFLFIYCLTAHKLAVQICSSAAVVPEPLQRRVGAVPIRAKAVERCICLTSASSCFAGSIQARSDESLCICRMRFGLKHILTEA
ncbi:unnamed protein product [Cylicostephanus goldi]|uniref:Uncharacterized protein n=1 Tax=Cylicostephanus goldi TaxID=71465 RepID=A0A3P6QSC5_CYLGO|nr:unnamed protein product [Cylicostephanus goldi]